MQTRMRLLTILTASLATLLAVTFTDAAQANREKFKTPPRETGIKRDLDGAPNIRLDNRAKHGEALAEAAGGSVSPRRRKPSRPPAAAAVLAIRIVDAGTIGRAASRRCHPAAGAPATARGTEDLGARRGGAFNGRGRTGSKRRSTARRPRRPRARSENDRLMAREPPRWRTHPGDRKTICRAQDIGPKCIREKPDTPAAVAVLLAAPLAAPFQGHGRSPACRSSSRICRSPSLSSSRSSRWR